MSALADQYEKRFPGACSDEAQKQERMERILHREERDSLRRTNRNRGVVITRLPVDEHGRLKP